MTIIGCKQNIDDERTWSVYKADESSSSHSPLDQINTSNVSRLKPVWTFTINDLPPSAQPANSQSNPIILDGVLYSLSAKRVAYAVNAATDLRSLTNVETFIFSCYTGYPYSDVAAPTPDDIVKGTAICGSCVTGGNGCHPDKNQFAV